MRLGKPELDQIDNYAQTVMNDDRFADPRSCWTFRLIGNELDPYARRKARAGDRVPGLIDTGHAPTGEPYETWVRSWSEVLEDASARLSFVTDRIGSLPVHDARLVALHERYARQLPAPSSSNTI